MACGGAVGAPEVVAAPAAVVEAADDGPPGTGPEQAENNTAATAAASRRRTRQVSAHTAAVGSAVEARRVGDAPLLTRRDIQVSHTGFEVQAVINPGAACLPNGDVVLLLRIVERPRSDIDPGPDALTLDFAGAHPKLVPLGRRLGKDEAVPIAFRDPRADELRYVPVYLPRELPGLDTSDPRGVEFTHPTLGTKTTFLTGISHLRRALSEDGVHFEVDAKPAIAPTLDLEEYGCEDARITLIGEVWHITYTSVSRVGITSSLATTRDFRTFEKHGAMLPPDQKDLVLFPELRDGRFVALTRPMPSSFGHVLGIWIAMPEGPLPWGAHKPLVLPREGHWDERHTGTGTAPFRCAKGWLEIYHGVDQKLDYRLGAVLLDGGDPSKLLARSEEPILGPERPYETAGLFPDVVYTCGHVPLDPDGRRIRVYYGAADSTVAAADFAVSEIIAALGDAGGPFGHHQHEVA